MPRYETQRAARLDEDRTPPLHRPHRRPPRQRSGEAGPLRRPRPRNPDTQDPTVLVTSPAAGTYDEGTSITAQFSCADDRSQPACSGTVAKTDGEEIAVRGGDNLPAAPGTYTLTVTALDEAGNDAAYERTYTVTSGSAPAPPACSDRKDNDRDHRKDFPGDPGCSSAEDNDETDFECVPDGETVCPDEPLQSIPVPIQGPLKDPSAAATP